MDRGIGGKRLSVPRPRLSASYLGIIFAVLIANLIILHTDEGVAANPADGRGPQVGSPVQPFTISEAGGEIVITEQGDLVLHPWSYQVEKSKPHVIQYMPGTLAGKEAFNSVTDRMKAELDPLSYKFTVIVDLNDAAWGTKALVQRRVNNNKKAYPLASFIVDEKGIGKQKWQSDATGLMLLTSPDGVIRAKLDSKSSAQDFAAFFGTLLGLLSTHQS
jgi:predicted transcriptional regulator